MALPPFYPLKPSLLIIISRQGNSIVRVVLGWQCPTSQSLPGPSAVEGCVDHRSRGHYATSMLNAFLVVNSILFVGQRLPFCEDFDSVALE